MAPPRVSLAAALLVLLVACAMSESLLAGHHATPRVRGTLASARARCISRAGFRGNVAVSRHRVGRWGGAAAGLILCSSAGRVSSPVLASHWMAGWSDSVPHRFVAIFAVDSRVARAHADFHPFLRTASCRRRRSGSFVRPCRHTDGVSIVLLIGAGLLMRSVMQILSQDHGFTPAALSSEDRAIG